MSTLIAVGSLLPQAGAPAKANTCRANVPGGEEACQVLLAVEGFVCRTINKPCLL